MYILDTNVVSELRKTVKTIDQSVLNWSRTVSSLDLYLSAITMLELETGILLVERRDKKQGQVLRVWLSEYVLPTFRYRVLAFDLEVAIVCAKLHVPDERSERDAMIAATALVHKKTIVTRNEKDFRETGAAIHNPWFG